MTLYFEDLLPGQEFRSEGRTLGESDILAFAGVSGDFNQLHMNDEWVRQNTNYRSRIAHGLLVLAVGSGLRTPGIDDLALLAYLEVQRQMKAPVYVNDTVSTVQAVFELIPRKTQKDSGVVKISVETFNQRGELVQTGMDTLLIMRRVESS